MAVENQSGSTNSIASVMDGNSHSKGGVQCDPEVHLKGMSSFGNDHLPKVRKPYTITKQREKWTEEEHQKFLEALKSYGRAWRRIEEHIGTKTAVQIRSHAQKFFSKIVRESSGSGEVSVEQIEIPPPRPKKKPLHPYPRKFVNSSNKGITVTVSFQPPERSSSPNLVTVEEENQSPTSVLSAFGSDISGSPVSDSPTSCTTDVHSINLLPTVKDNVFIASDSFGKEEKGSLSSVQLTSGSPAENLLVMNSDLGSKDAMCAKENAAVEASSTTIKLFGRTVLVTDSEKTSSLTSENNYSKPSKNVQENFETDINELVQEFLPNQLETQFALGTIYGNWRAWPYGAPVLHSMGFLKEGSNSMGVTPDTSLPGWTLRQGLSIPYVPSYNQTSDTCVEEKMREREISCTGSNAGSVGEVENGNKNLDAVDSRFEQTHPEKRGNPLKYAKGFVPYKRCLSQRDYSSSVIVAEEREGQKIRVCL